jgi:hypothetical protein
MHSSNSSSYLHVHARTPSCSVVTIYLYNHAAVSMEHVTQARRHIMMSLNIVAAAGSGSDTEQQIFHLLHQDKSRLLGLMPPKPAAAADVAQLTTELAGLSDSLVQQQQQGGSDSSNTEGGAELIIANGVWTKGIPAHEQYAAKMIQLFKVC